MRPVCGRFADSLRADCGWWLFAGVLRAFCGRFAGVLRAFCGRFAGVLRAFCGRFAGVLRAVCGRAVGCFAGVLQAFCERFAGGLRAVCRRLAGVLRLAVCGYDSVTKYTPRDQQNATPIPIKLRNAQRWTSSSSLLKTKTMCGCMYVWMFVSSLWRLITEKWRELGW